VKFKEAKDKQVIVSKKSKNWKIAQPKDACDRGAWWQVFHDEQLNSLEAQLNSSNQTIINSYYNYQQAYALVDEARASFFPTLAGSVTLIRQKPSSGGSSSSGSSSGTITTSSGTISGSSGGGSSAKITTTHTLSLNASWEPDIWGLVRRQVEAAAGGAQASAALLASTRLLAQASLAQYYFELRGLDIDQKLLNDTVAAYKKDLQVTKNRYAAGVAARGDVLQAQSQLETAQASAINNGILRGQYEHAIAMLIGVPPGNFALLSARRRVTPPPIPLGLASELLERRPDIAQAERLMAQANAQIGVAVAAYFPTLTLSGLVDFVGQDLSHWISLPAMGWSYGAQLADTIIDGGLRSATVRAAQAGYMASVASYRQIVLAAFQDVEDNLVSLRLLNQQAATLDKAAADARLALTFVINQYKAGTVDYSSVVTAQNTAFAAEKSAADVNYLRMTSAVGLIRALGGGWNASEIACAAS